MKMEYIHAALLLHQSGKKISEENLRKVVEAAGLQADEAKIKVLVSSLNGVDVKKVLEDAKARPVAVAAVAPVAAASHAGDGKAEAKAEKAEKKEEEKKEEAAEGLSALFG